MWTWRNGNPPGVVCRVTVCALARQDQRESAKAATADAIARIAITARVSFGGTRVPVTIRPGAEIPFSMTATCSGVTAAMRCGQRARLVIAVAAGNPADEAVVDLAGILVGGRARLGESRLEPLDRIGRYAGGREPFDIGGDRRQQPLGRDILGDARPDREREGFRRHPGETDGRSTGRELALVDEHIVEAAGQAAGEEIRDQRAHRAGGQ